MRQLKGTDVVFRSAVDPNFRPRKNKRAFDAKQFFCLSNATNGFETSLVWQYLAPTLDYVHAFGERLANGFNQTNSTSSRSVYCGAYAMNVSDVRALVGARNLNEV